MVASRGPVTLAVSIVMSVLATIFVAARFFTRGYLVRSIKQDDWWILAAWLTGIGFSAAICVGVSDGLGMHLTDIPDWRKDNLRRAQYAFSILYNPALMLTKTSIIVFYLSVMSKDVDPVFKWCNWICLAVVNIAGAALTFLNIFQCRPVSAGWIFPTPQTAKCTDIVTLYLSSAPVNIVTDLALLILPIPILTGLRLPKKQKIILIVTFSAGIFIAVVDVVRIAYLQSAALDRLTVVNTDTDNGGQTQRIVESTDFPWYASLSFMWSAIEVNVGIICACVPSLKPLFLRFAPSFIKDANDDPTPVSSMDAEEKRNTILPTTSTDINVLTHPAAFRRPAIEEYDGDEDGDYMGFLNMLAGPLDNTSDRKDRRKETTMSTLSRTTTAGSAASDFDFVNMDKNRNMLKLNNRQSLWPVLVVTTIFFLWGFAYGLLDTLNAQFQVIAKLSEGQALGLHAAYFGGYFVGPLTLGRFMLHRYGFKPTMITGLCVYGCGTLVFWPSAVLTSYAAFVVSNFIVGFGLSCLEVAANPYIALCGPLEYAEVRLNFSQAFQGCGTVCSPLLAQRVLFKDVLNAPSLVNVQWTYLGIGLFDFLLALIFYYIPLPEATEEQLEEQADKRSAVYRTRVGPFRVVWVTLALGTFSQWCYVGAQEGNGGKTQALMRALRPKGALDPFDYETVGHTTFAVGRFLGAFLNYMLKPRWILLLCFVGALILSAIQMDANGTSGVAVNQLLYFFEGSMFPIIYAISMRGLGDQTWNGAAVMTTAISSGAVVPPILYGVTRTHSVKYSYCVMVAVFAFGMIFPLYLNFVPAARKQVDPIHESRDRRRRARRALRTNSAFSEASTAAQFGLSGIIARRKKKHGHQPSGDSFTGRVQSEHVERTNSSELGSPMSPRTSQNQWQEHVGMQTPNPAKTRRASIAKSVRESVAKVGGLGFKSSLLEEEEEDYSSRSRESNSSSSHIGSSDVSSRDFGSDEEKLEATNTTVRREWTEMDDVRDDYHKVLRGL